MEKEFKTLLVHRAFQREGVQHIYVPNEVMVFVSERAIKTIKTKTMQVLYLQTIIPLNRPITGFRRGI